jgi:hypothetical protein
MTGMEEELPKLANGSRLIAPGVVIDKYGDRVYSLECFVYIERDDNPGACKAADVTDVLHVIDRANLDPVRVAARELINAIEAEFGQRCIG